MGGLESIHYFFTFLPSCLHFNGIPAIAGRGPCTGQLRKHRDFLRCLLHVFLMLVRTGTPFPAREPLRPLLRGLCRRSLLSRLLVLHCSLLQVRNLWVAVSGYLLRPLHKICSATAFMSSCVA